MIFNDYTSNYKELLDKAKAPDLYTSRVHSIAVETFKSLRKLNPAFLHDSFTPQVENYQLRGVAQLEIPRVRTDKYGTNSFKFQGAKIWNSLSLRTMCAESPKHMKKALLEESSVNMCQCETCLPCRIRRM